MTTTPITDANTYYVNEGSMAVVSDQIAKELELAFNSEKMSRINYEQTWIVLNESFGKLKKRVDELEAERDEARRDLTVARARIAELEDAGGRYVAGANERIAALETELAQSQKAFDELRIEQDRRLMCFDHVERIAALEAERDRWREVACRFLDACAGTYNPEAAEQAAEMFDELKAALAGEEKP